MADAAHKSGFSGVKAKIYGSEEAARFMYLLPAVKLVDDALDKESAEKWWRFGDARIGDVPCQFLENVLHFNPKAKKKFDDLQRVYKESSADVWQVCNLLCVALHRIAELTGAVRHDDTVENRQALAEAHERLSVLAVLCTAKPSGELAQTIRRISKGNNDPLDAIYEALTKDATITVGKHTFPVREFGAAQQIIDDANDFISDLRTEVEHGRITPNRFVARLKREDIDPKLYLDGLKAVHARYFKAKKNIPGEGLGIMHRIIKEELGKYPDFVAAFRKPMAVRGFDATASFFPTFNVDHTQNMRQSGRLTGDLTWGQRLTNLFKRDEQRSGIGAP